MKTTLVSSQVLCVTLRLTSVQSEMKFIEGSDTVALKQHFGKKILELEDEKRTVQVNLKPLNLMVFFLGELIFTCCSLLVSYCSKRGTGCWVKLKILLIVMDKHRNCKMSIPRS